MVTLTVRITPGEAENIIAHAVKQSGMSVEKIGSHHSKAPDGRETLFSVYDKYYMRNSSRASLSILIENVSGKTTVVAISSGGSQGALINFDWGSSANFERVVSKAMQPYTLYD